MKALRLTAFLLLAALAACAQDNRANVNERYTVESVQVTGVDQSRLARAVREAIHELIGQKFSQERLDALSRLINRALPDRVVSIRIGRGDVPNHVKIVIEIRDREHRLDLAAPKALYSSRQGWTGEVDATVRLHSNSVTFGILSDGDTLAERASGIRARYENRQIADGRLRLAFEFADLHEAWNPATRELAGDTLYRARRGYQPMATVTLARPLKLTCGFNFEQLQPEFPAAHTEASNAVITTLRYDRSLEESGPNQHRVEAGYNLRAATSSLGSDFEYTRHTFEFRYTLWHGVHRATARVTAGLLNGTAPVFERFVAGTSTLLRGWNKYDLAPVGGNRVVCSSVEYQYRSFEVFYDAGSVWSSGQPVVARHSVGAGVHLGDLALLLAFPIRNGRPEPVFIAGLNL
jgi:hypothetical protein